MTTTTLDLGACPTCGAPRRVGPDPDRPWRPAVRLDHAPGCTPAAVPLAGPGCDPHAWTRLPDPHLPQSWCVERCRRCGVARVVHDGNPEPTNPIEEKPMTTTTRNLALRTCLAVANEDEAALRKALFEAATTPAGGAKLILELASMVNANARALAPDDWQDQLKFIETVEEEEP